MLVTAALMLRCASNCVTACCAMAFQLFVNALRILHELHSYMWLLTCLLLMF